MIKSTFKVIVGILLTATLSLADGGDFVDIKVGFGQWNADKPTGKIGADAATAIDLVNDFAIEKGTATYVWAEFQHFLPIIPHFRVEYEQMPFPGTPGTTSIDVGGNTYTFDSKADLYLDNVDAILFYDIGLFDDFLDLNYGVGAKVIMGEITGEVAGQTQTMPVAGVAAYVYVNGRIEPALGLGLEVEYKWFPASVSPDLEFSEYIAKVDYTLELIPLLDLGVEAGVRGMDLLINSPSNSLYTEQAFSGVFFGIFAKLEI